MTTFLILLAFVIGFFIGVFERKIDRVKVTQATIRKMLPKFVQPLVEEQSEVLRTPTDEEYEEEQNKEFSRKIK